MILIVGATGLLGGMIARQLLQQGKPVRILVQLNSPSEQMAQQGMPLRPPAWPKPTHGWPMATISGTTACQATPVRSMPHPCNLTNLPTPL